MLDKNDEKTPDKTAEKSGSKRSKFVRLAESRTINAIKAIRVIGKLGNRAAYDFTDADVKKITGALNREVEALKTRMTSTGEKDSVDFKL